MRKKSILIATLAFFTIACRGESTVTEEREDGDVQGAVKSQGATESLLIAGLVLDMNEQSHSQRKNWFATNMVGLSESDGDSASPSGKPCQLTLNHSRGSAYVALEEKSAYPLPHGRVVYCSGGKLGWASQDNTLKDRALKLGVLENEMEGVSFFRVPLDVPNSFAAITEKNEGLVVVFEGITQFSNQYSLDSESVLAGVVAHELGQIKELRKDGQTQLKSTQERLRTACLAKPSTSSAPALARLERIESCRSNIRANSRLAKYAADEFVVQVVGRKKYATGLRPTELGKFYRNQSSAGRDPADAHPDALERAIQFERNLERSGINILTGGILRPGEAEAKPR